MTNESTSKNAGGSMIADVEDLPWTVEGRLLKCFVCGMNATDKIAGPNKAFATYACEIHKAQLLTFMNLLHIRGAFEVREI